MKDPKLKKSDIKSIAKANDKDLLTNYIDQDDANGDVVRPLDERVGPDLVFDGPTLRRMIAKALGVSEDDNSVSNWVDSHKK